MDLITQSYARNWVKFPIQIKCEGEHKKPIYPYGWAEIEESASEKVLKGAQAVAVLTGKKSGITVVDVDNEEALYALEKQFSMSMFDVSNFIVKTKKGWHFYFAYEPSLKTSTRFAGIRGVDIRNDGGNVIVHSTVPCAHYEILREPEGEELLPFPDRMVYNNNFASPDSRSIVMREENVAYANSIPLAIQLQSLFQCPSVDGRFINMNEDALMAAKRITPQRFRNGEMGGEYVRKYEDKGYLHPDDIDDGDGYEYLKSVRGILAAEKSVGFDLFNKTLLWVRDQWTNPGTWTDERLGSEILALKEDADIWAYDEGWEEKFEESGQIAMIRAHGYEIFIDNPSGDVVMFNPQETDPALRFQHYPRNIFSSTIFKAKFSTKEPFKEWHNLDVRKRVFDPTRNEVFFENKARTEKFYNVWHPSLYIQLFERHEKPKNEPTHINAIIENLFPEEDLRELFLDWLYWLFKSREKSQVAWIIISKQGAGKSVMLDLLARAIGEEFANPNVNQAVFEEKYTDWWHDKVLVGLNEIDATRYGAKDKKNELKTLITEKKQASRGMYQRSEVVQNWANFIITTNDTVPVFLEESDRRFNISEARCPLKEVPLFRDIVGTTKFLSTLQDELPDFIRQLSQRKPSFERYNTTIKSKAKNVVLYESMPPMMYMLRLLKDKEFDQIEDEAGEYFVGNELKLSKLQKDAEERGFLIAKDVKELWRSWKQAKHRTPSIRTQHDYAKQVGFYVFHKSVRLPEGPRRVMVYSYVREEKTE